MAIAGMKGFFLGFVTGFGSGFVVRSFIDNPREKLAPVARAVARGAVLVTERSREMAAHFGELLQDTLAEVNVDLRNRGEKQSAKVAPRPATVRARSMGRVKSPRRPLPNGKARAERMASV